MAITIRQFKVAMETYGAKRITNTRNPIIPIFKVGAFEFVYSDSNYIIPYKQKIPKGIMDRAMQKCEDCLLLDQEVHSIDGMLTLAAIIDDKYNKDFVDGMINETYKKLLEEMDIHSNPEFPFHNADSAKMEELSKVLVEYGNVANPFGSKKNLKDPIDYLDSIDITFNDKNQNGLLLCTKSVYAIFAKDKSDWIYHSTCFRRNSNLTLSHYYDNGDEIVLFSDEANGNSQDEPNKFKLEINLKTGLAWQNDEEEKAMPVTDKQIEMMIDCLKISIEEIWQNIVRYMVSDN